MTRKELKEISKEIEDISQQISLLDPCNVIENQLRERLFHRWDFLDYQLKVALISAKKQNKWSIVDGEFIFPSESSKPVKTMRPKLRVIG